jgi:hypothetical protein
MRSKRLAIIALGIVLPGCHKQPGVTVLMPPPMVVTVAVPVSAPVPVPMDIPASLPGSVGPGLFEQGELAFDIGDYVEAIRDYETYLRWMPNGDRIDEVLFHVGMAYVLRTKPPANWQRATANLRRLVNEHPDSPLKPTANLILSLHSHADQLARDVKARNQVMQQLSTELERLKKIDANRLKRP